MYKAIYYTINIKTHTHVYDLKAGGGWGKGTNRKEMGTNGGNRRGEMVKVQPMLERKVLYDPNTTYHESTPIRENPCPCSCDVTQASSPERMRSVLKVRQAGPWHKCSVQEPGYQVCRAQGKL